MVKLLRRFSIRNLLHNILFFLSGCAAVLLNVYEQKTAAVGMVLMLLLLLVSSYFQDIHTFLLKNLNVKIAFLSCFIALFFCCGLLQCTFSKRQQSYRRLAHQLFRGSWDRFGLFLVRCFMPAPFFMGRWEYGQIDCQAVYIQSRHCGSGRNSDRDIGSRRLVSFSEVHFVYR